MFILVDTLTGMPVNNDDGTIKQFVAIRDAEYYVRQMQEPTFFSPVKYEKPLKKRCRKIRGKVEIL